MAELDQLEDQWERSLRILREIAEGIEPHKALPDDVRRRAQARLVAYDRLLDCVDRAGSAVHQDWRRIAMNYVSTSELMVALAAYQNEPSAEHHKQLIDRFERATIDMTARRETVEQVLKLRQERKDRAAKRKSGED